MFMRIVEINVSPEKFPGFRKLFDERILPALKRLHGCISANLMQSQSNQDEYLSITLWDQQESAESYEQSGLFQELLEEARPFLAESSEWKVQLSKDLKLEYKPVEQDPVVKSYPVVAETGDPEESRGSALLKHMRVVSLHIELDKQEEFRQLYNNTIIPALIKVDGCLYAYLVEDQQQEEAFYSVTVWQSRQDAENYEQSGLFEALTEKTKHTFSALYQWKIQLEKEAHSKLATSEDMKLNHYEFVTGQKFQ